MNGPLTILVLLAGVVLLACGPEIANYADRWRHERQQRAMVRRVEARRRWVEQRGSFPQVTERRR